MIVPLANRALAAVTGEDWRSFLQGLLTQDVETLAAGEIRFGALLTAQGRLLHDLFILGREDGCWLDVEADQRAALIQRLTIYKLRAKVTLEALDTPVAAVLEEARPASGDWFADPRMPALGWRGYGLAADGDGGLHDLRRLALGVPGPADWAGETTYPIEANFDLLNGIDFKKGCFVGQETTSRMKRRGAIKNRMLPIVFEGPPPAHGAEVLAGERRAGEVLSGVEGRAMALLRLDRIEGADLSVDGRAVRVETPEWFAPAA
ncbi:MAG: folate-binding protein YgfZ [Caulobacteraceae bacterium]|nr:folate-binding protein YgfZ [Caulobacteraceae bacterium]